MESLSVDQIIKIHNYVLEKSGGCFGIRDENLLTSAINSPFQTFNNESLYKTDLEKITRVVYGIIMNHSFLDGNKRTASIVLIILLKINQFLFEINKKELADIITDIAAGNMSYESFLNWIQQKVFDYI